jgi:nucleoside-diphosphate-sugar epimerase
MNAAAGNDGHGKRALLTGARGFTGQYMARALAAAGYAVYGTDLPAGGATQPVDLLDRAAVAALVQHVQPDVVVHLAAIAFVAHADTEQLYRVNVVGTRNLLEALAGLARRPRAVLLASSANVYGNTLADPIDERVPPAPANDYAVSKLAMEHMARLWSDRLPLIVARPFNYTGVGQDELFLLPKIVAHFRRGAPHIELGNLQVVRDFSDVRNTVASYMGLLAAAPAGQTFNVCSGVGHALGEVLDMMAGIAGYRIGVRVNPTLVRANEVARLVGDDRKLRGLIGAAAPLPLADTLRWMYQA